MPPDAPYVGPEGGRRQGARHSPALAAPLASLLPLVLALAASLSCLLPPVSAAGAIAWNGNWAYACDFKGGDLTSASGIPGSQCSTACANKAGCTHYTWTTFQGGTCYMKGGRGAKQDAVSTTDNTMICGILAVNFASADWASGCDFYNSDLTAVSGTPASQCGPLCQARSDCTHYTWTSSQGGTCYMKKGPAGKQDAFLSGNNTMVCGLTPISWQTGNWAYGCDFYQGDLASAPTTAEKCGPQCQAKPGCTHFTWTTYQGGTCYMKQGPTSKQDAVVTRVSTMVCGIVSSSVPSPPPPSASSSRVIAIANKCAYPVWMAILTNSGTTPLPEGTVQLNPGQSHTYTIPAGGWAGRFWPMIGCSSAGTNCAFGNSVPPCPSTGCQPPADTKIEFYYPSTSSGGNAWYDISLVDGYSLPVSITPRGVNSGSCTPTSCAVYTSSCPTNEINGIGNLGVIQNGQTVACLSPCKKWNYPPPYGFGKSEAISPGLEMCCPTPPISPDQCRAGPVVLSQYVKLIRQQCPSAYSFAYDDANGLHSCPQSVSFDVTTCI